MVLIKHASPKAMTTVRMGFEVLVDANVRKNPGMGRGAGTLWAKLCSCQAGESGGDSRGVGKDWDLLLFPDTDFLFRWYQPLAHLLCGAGALKMSLLASSHSLHLLPPSQGGRGSG